MSTFPERGPRVRPSRGQRAVAILLVLLALAAMIGRHGLAADGGKTITLGESLSEAERQELLDYFEAGPDDRVETVTVDETKQAMEGIADFPISSAYSSTALTCRELGDGLEVRTRNISLITPSLYAIALVTAGIGDAELRVAAPNAAAAQGLTALTGVFKTWDIAPCDSGNTSSSRQRLALQQITIAVEISEVIQVQDPIKVASDIVLFTQQAVVVNGLKDAGEISDAIGDQEAVQGISIPAEQRQKLVDFMVELAAEDIDWSTFSAGWTIEPTDDGNGIQMFGDGIAIRNAQATATVRASENMTATALAGDAAAATQAAEAEMTATASAEMTAQAGLDEDAAAATEAAESEMMTATAEARAAADAQATEAALAAAMTATALAEPTPTPEATPEPIAVTGEVTDIRGGQVWVKPTGLEDVVAYTVPADASILRGGDPVTLASLQAGDKVSLSVDTRTQTVRELSASAPAKPGVFSKFAKFLFIIPALAVIPLIIFLRGRGGGSVGDPFIVKRVASA